MDSLDLAVYALATWRLASLFVNEAGPGNVFLYLREWAGMTHDGNGEKVIIPETFWGGLLSCVWCASVWSGGFWILFDWIWLAFALRLAGIFAVSAVAIGFQCWVENR